MPVSIGYFNIAVCIVMRNTVSVECYIDFSSESWIFNFIIVFKIWSFLCFLKYITCGIVSINWGSLLIVFQSSRSLSYVWFFDPSVIKSKLVNDSMWTDSCNSQWKQRAWKTKIQQVNKEKKALTCAAKLFIELSLRHNRVYVHLKL